MEDKTKAIVSHLTLIGWVIAFVINSKDKTQLASFYIRQMLGLVLLGIACNIVLIIPVLGWIVGGIGSLATLVFWIMSLIGSFSGEEKLTPIVGEHFQNWFSGL